MNSKIFLRLLAALALLAILRQPGAAGDDKEMFVVVNNDDGAPGYVEEEGNWYNSNSWAQCLGITNLTSRYAVLSDLGAKAAFTPDIPIEGYYLIEMVVPLAGGSSDHALYEICWGGGVAYDSIWIDQNTPYLCDWRNLGVYHLTQGVADKVSVINDGTGAGGFIRADLMKFTFLHSVPMVLSNFQAFGEKGCIVVEWITESEVNCLKWQVCRSDEEDGEYAGVGELSGHAFTESEHAYRWVDRQVCEGVTYFYKLRQVDFHGSEWWSQAVSAIARSSIPESYVLSQNHPNPFNTSTEIRYQLPEDSHVTLKIFNTMGQEVRTLVDADRQAGGYSVHWDGLDADCREVASGLYFCRLRAGEFGKTIKMVLVR